MTAADTLAAKVHMPLENSFLCLEEDCRHVSNCSSICPACASTHVASIATWLKEREPATQLDSIGE